MVGSLVGALPLHPRQNSQLGLPLVLLPEETTLMREKGCPTIYLSIYLSIINQSINQSSTQGVLGLWEYVSPALGERDCQLFQELRTLDVQEQVLSHTTPSHTTHSL